METRGPQLAPRLPPRLRLEDWELLGQGHTAPRQDAADPGKVHR